MGKSSLKRRGMTEYHQSFSQLYEEFEGNAFVQSIIDKLYRDGYCSFSKKEQLGENITIALREAGITFELEEVDDATFDVVITPKGLS